jgi:hypothetical protein
VIAVVLLLAGAVGGGYLGLKRQQQNRLDAQESQVSLESQLNSADSAQLYAAEANRDSAVQAAKAKADAAAAAAAIKAKEAEDLARTTQTASRSSTRTTNYGPVPTSCAVYTGNRAIGCTLMLQWGYGLEQMPCLDKMWTKESNWRTTADNPTSHSYGIPQALPAGKLAKYGSDWRTNPVPQIKWGLDYIQNRYNSPCGAWAFWQAHNWY